MADPRFATRMDRVVNLDAVLALAEEELVRWPIADLVARGRRFGAPIAPVHDVAGFLDDPHVAARGAVVRVEDPEAGPMRFLPPPTARATPPAT